MQRKADSVFAEGLADLRAALRAHHLATTFSWQDIAQRYRRSRVGAFWLTVNMGALIGAMGLTFGTLFRAPLYEFLPFICVGLIFWSFISTALTEGCTSFINAQGIILQVRIPLFTHILTTLYRNAIVLAHNLLIYPLVLLAVARLPSWHGLLAFPGFLLIALNVAWMTLILAVVCARFRDLTQVVQNLLQVAFFVTPLMWLPQSLPEGRHHVVLDLNPFFHLISLVRAPLLGEWPTAANWLSCIAMAVVGWALALPFYGRYRDRIPYWL